MGAGAGRWRPTRLAALRLPPRLAQLNLGIRNPTAKRVLLALDGENSLTPRTPAFTGGQVRWVPPRRPAAARLLPCCGGRSPARRALASSRTTRVQDSLLLGLARVHRALLRPVRRPTPRRLPGPPAASRSSFAGETTRSSRTRPAASAGQRPRTRTCSSCPRAASGRRSSKPVETPSNRMEPLFPNDASGTRIGCRQSHCLPLSGLSHADLVLRW